MTKEEKIRFLAEEVMGWELTDVRRGDIHIHGNVWNPFENVGQALGLVDALYNNMNVAGLVPFININGYRDVVDNLSVRTTQEERDIYTSDWIDFRGSLAKTIATAISEAVFAVKEGEESRDEN